MWRLFCRKRLCGTNNMTLCFLAVTRGPHGRKETITSKLNHRKITMLSLRDVRHSKRHLFSCRPLKTSAALTHHIGRRLGEHAI